jgi:uncharacterized membrane protein YgdD (TMEM256/DUF423 family)
MLQQLTLIFACIFGALAIILGAFGAHALKKKFTEEQMSSFETGVKYQMYHAIVLLIIGLTLPMLNTLEWIISLSFITGTLLFSFSIYGLCLSGSRGKKIKALGPVTPLGGLLLLIGWLCLLIFVMSYAL